MKRPKIDTKIPVVESLIGLADGVEDDALGKLCLDASETLTQCARALKSAGRVLEAAHVMVGGGPLSSSLYGGPLSQVRQALKRLGVK